MSQPYAGTFTISLPVVQGMVKDGNGQPVSGVLLSTSTGFSPATTDANGNYALGFLPGSSFSVTPSAGSLVFVPSSLSSTNIANSISNQNYFAVSTVAALLTGHQSGTNFALAWQGVQGVNYQLYSSTNLIDWTPSGAPVPGVSGSMQLSVTLGNEPLRFFRVLTTY